MMNRCFFNGWRPNWYAFLPGFVLDEMGRRDVEKHRKWLAWTEKATIYELAVDMNRLADQIGISRPTSDEYLETLKQREEAA